MVEYKIKSGSFIGTTGEFKALIMGLFHEGINAGVDEALDIYIPHVAKRFGNLRREFKLMIERQVAGLEGKKRVTIDFKKLLSPTYGEFHVFGPTGEAKSTSPYKHASSYLKRSPRTKTGTRPIVETEFMRLLYSAILKNIKLFFSQEGLNFRDYIGAKL